MSRLLIVDGHAYAYRAFHAIRELRAPDGSPTNAIYGFIKMLEKMRGALQPKYLIVVWDGGLSAARMKALPGYKAQRPEMPGELRPQLNEISNWLTAAGIAEFCGDGVEADDYIGCLARQAERAGYQVVIASSDKDFMQLVSDQVGLLNPNDKTGAVWGAQEVVAKTGVKPEMIVDWLALMGDAVDNIPGVPGVGPKTAAALLNQFGTIDEMFRRLGEVKSDKTREALRSAEADVRRNLHLVRLHDVECEFAPEKLLPGTVKVNELKKLFQQWGFKGMLAGLTVEPQQEQLI